MLNNLAYSKICNFFTGIPRHKRGEIWEFLSEYNESEWVSCGNSVPASKVPYEELLKLLTSHQHSILIDIGMFEIIFIAYR